MKKYYGGFWRRLLAAAVDLAVIWSVQSFILVKIFNNPPQDLPLLASFLIFEIILIWLYFILFESSSLASTPGKLLLGLVVTDLYGRPISFYRANKRFWSKFFSLLPLAAGFIQAAFSKRRQALHDFLADTLVFKKQYQRRFVTFRCRSCRKEARLPKYLGRIKVKCPKCRKVYTVAT